MAVTWTEEQRKVISLRNRNILVSAAAGSGKTAVLVQRILGKITDPGHPIDIDRLLIMTFTKAAAGEMKERISRALETALYEDPENEHLQRQMTLIHTAQITTIDGFCSWLLRNYFHMIGLDPGYRVADEGELKLLKEDVLKELIEALYQEKDEDFLQFAECYAAGKTDESLKEYILDVYDTAMSNPYPKEWLEEAVRMYQTETLEELKQAPWMELMWKTVFEELSESARLIEEAQEICRKPGGPYLYEAALESDSSLVQVLKKKELARDYDGAYTVLADHTFARLSTAKMKDVEPAYKDAVKALREEEKEILKELGSRYFIGTQEELLSLLRHCRGSMETLVRITLRFMREFADKKQKKGMLDFTDMEHFALRILMEKEEDGTFHMTDAARELSEKYDEVMVDEYQDSNLVQEYLTTAVSGWVKEKKNIFMVGDVKQSIYRFRLARPELFMEKYKTYRLEDAQEQRVDLHKNFRSRPEVLSSVNYLFRQLMGEDLGGIIYDSAAALYPGADYPPGEDPRFPVTEILLMEKDQEELQEVQELQNERELEALALGHRIKEMAGKDLVYDKETQSYRPAEYGDIAVLLRTSTGWAESFTQVFDALGIPSYTASRTGYFSAQEVATVLNYLRVCDNPLQDIPLAGVLRSPIVGLTTQELAMIRARHPVGLLYSCVKAYVQTGSEDEKIQEEDPLRREIQSSLSTAEDEEILQEDPLRRKLQSFLMDLEHIRDLAEFTPIHELVSYILQSTGYGNYVRALPGGEQRSANLQMLIEQAMDYEKTSYRGLFNFVRYIEKLQKHEVDFGEVNLSGAGKACVKIMTIHKSKGLEFPIVFLAGMGKQFNFSDIRAQLLIHPELGLGADAIYPDRRVILQTLHKQVIRREIQKENLGEELRILYVALTRAKEKLILIGAIKDLEKQVQSLTRFRSREEELLPLAVRMRAKTYWDFVLPALSRHPCMDGLFERYGILSGRADGEHGLTEEEKTCMCLRVITARDLVLDELEDRIDTQLREETLKNWDPKALYDEAVRELLEERFSFVYPYRYLREIPAKVSVSELKKRSYHDDEERESGFYVEHDIVPLIPGFIAGEEEKAYEGAARGTAYHRVMECLDYHQVSDIREIKRQIQSLKEQQKLTEAEERCVQPEDILHFLETPLGERMRRAGTDGRLFREQPFVISEEASLLDERWNSEERVLIQGIIDAYFLEDTDLILVDYKTDKVPDGTGQCLVDLYHVQLEDYAKALERLTGRKVRESYIYSFTLGKEIRLG